MEKLENKIEDKVVKYISSPVMSSEDISKEIAHDVKDIAIAFAKWKGSKPLNYMVNKLDSEPYYVKKTDTELFTDFIKAYYK